MGKVELIHGDCLEKMKDIPDGSVDMILCDLPYGTTACSWDLVVSFDKLWEQYNRICKETSPIVLFGQEPFSSTLRLSNIGNWKYDWYWEKERLTNISQVKKRAGKTIETISVFYRKQCTYNPQMSKHHGKLRSNKVKNGKMGILTDSGEKKVFEYNDTGFRYPTQLLTFQRDCLKSNLHPTQKPVLLCEYLVKTFTNDGDTVLDNCMGSGTTGVACKKLNRSFIGIKLDPEYFKIAEKRINETL
jgi:site-specific DNA-methyltransferase (adenine-specific)